MYKMTCDSKINLFTYGNVIRLTHISMLPNVICDIQYYLMAENSKSLSVPYSVSDKR